jgi:hypothetical protein
MFVQVDRSITEMQGAVNGLDVASLTGMEAARLVQRLGRLKRLTDGLLAHAALRIDETNAHHGHGERSAAEFCARRGGAEQSEMRAAINTARALPSLPEVDQAVRAGELSMHHASLIAPIADAHPAVAAELIERSKDGTQALRQACSKARSHFESERDRTSRHRSARTFRMWTGEDGMVCGAFALVPESGGLVKAIIERCAQRKFIAGSDNIDQVTADVFVDLIVSPDASQPANVEGESDFEVAQSNSHRGDPTPSDPTPSDPAQRGTDQGSTAQGSTRSADVTASASFMGDQAATLFGSCVSDTTLPFDRAATLNTAPSLPRPDDGSCAASAELPQRRQSSAVQATVHVLIDHAALVRGNALQGETCEIAGVGSVNVQWVRSLLGDAVVTAVIKKGRDIATVAHLGRHIPALLQTALIAGGRECVVHGCHGHGYLEIDHSEVDFAKGGPAAWWNLGWLCSQHHRLKSSGWVLGPPDPCTGKRQLFPPLRRAD